MNKNERIRGEYKEEKEYHGNHLGWVGITIEARWKVTHKILMDFRDTHSKKYITPPLFALPTTIIIYPEKSYK